MREIPEGWRAIEIARLCKSKTVIRILEYRSGNHSVTSRNNSRIHRMLPSLESALEYANEAAEKFSGGWA